MSYLDNLNPEQRDAAMHTDGPLLILAGAGSGKTSTMTHRIAYLIKEKGVSPKNILAVTFTNKAAGEMRERVEALIGGNASMWILTFHATCLRFLRANAERTGYKSNFVVYDTTDQKAAIKFCIKELGIEDKSITPQYVLSIISDCKEKGISPAQFRKENAYDFKTGVVSDLYDKYERLLRSNNAMDFDDLLLRGVELLEKNKDILEAYQDRFQYVMVDEYQDTNYMQYKLISLIAAKHQNLCVVGDDDQCIYQWRGADIKNILDFEKDFDSVKVVKLEQNYRSHSWILDAAYSVIKNNRGRKPKKLWTERKDGEKIVYNRTTDERDEARYIVSEIDKIKNASNRYSDFAVLYRTNAQSRIFEEFFLSKNIPYRVLGGTRYYDRKEIKDMMAYMRLVQNPDDDLSLERIINEPKRGIGAKTLEKIRAYAAVQNVSLLEILGEDEILTSLSAKSLPGITAMLKVLNEFAEEKDNLKVSDIYEGLLVRTGYVKALEDQNTIEAEGRIENLLEFKSVIHEYEEENQLLNLSEFLEKLTLMAEVDNHRPDEDAVVLMTLHSSKGLEFPVVFMPGMEDGLFPSWRSLDTPNGLEEERRLCYVGMTRAIDRLYMVSAAQRTLYGKTNFTMESQFVKEIDSDLFEVTEALIQRNARVYEEERGSVFKPFDQLKYIKQRQHETAKRDDIDIKDGDRVRHNKFGEGLVITVQDNGQRKTATIAFDSVGMKQLALDIAPLEKI